MKAFAALALCLLLTACASVPAPQPSETLFQDGLFTPIAERISAAEVFALSADMQAYVTGELARVVRAKGGPQGLFDALYDKGLLQLEYDGVMTRNAAQAFSARAGNCLSLVIMTAAFAKELGLPVRYQNVFVDETWARSGDFYLSVGHVNLALGNRPKEFGNNEPTLTIDFLPPRDTRGLRSWAIDESMVVAMYMNNRAVEAMTAGNVNEAYWWARQALVEDRRFLSAQNTLGVVYHRHGNLPEAQRTFENVLEREPANTSAMSNLAAVLEARGQVAAAKELMQKLQRIEPNPPFAYYKRGLAAMQAGNFRLAKEMFAKEVDRAAYYHEFHFWLALAYARLGEMDKARAHVKLAAENSTTRGDRDLYAAKLERLQANAPVIRR